MTKHHKKLNEMVERINEFDFLSYELKINRRNGYYNVDKFDKKGAYRGSMFTGDYRETESFLLGLAKSFFYLKTL